MRRSLLTRRHFLGASGIAIAASLVYRPALAFPQAPRTLKFVHTHTGESLVATYSQAGCYSPECLEQINHFLRDFRTGETHAIDPRLLDTLFDLQVQANRDDAFQVISGYRSPKTNSQLRSKSHGVAEHSMHMEGRAIDIRLSGYPTRKLHELAMSLQRGGVGYYARSDFVHVDTGRIRLW